MSERERLCQGDPKVPRNISGRLQTPGDRSAGDFSTLPLGSTHLTIMMTDWDAALTDYCFFPNPPQQTDDLPAFGFITAEYQITMATGVPQPARCARILVVCLSCGRHDWRLYRPSPRFVSADNATLFCRRGRQDNAYRVSFLGK